MSWSLWAKQIVLFVAIALATGAATYVGLSVLLSLSGCSSHQQIVKPFEHGATCINACAKLSALGCDEAKPIAGITCKQFCESTLASGGAVFLEVECVAGAESKEQVRLCNVDCGR
jgi:hypothetical protein